VELARRLDSDVQADPDPLGLVTVILNPYVAPAVAPFQEPVIVTFWLRLMVEGTAFTAYPIAPQALSVVKATATMESAMQSAMPAFVFKFF